MTLLSLIFFTLLVFNSICNGLHETQCGLYLAPSLLGPSAGRGVYAGSSIVDGETVIIEQSLVVKYSSISGTQLNNYVYNAEEDGFSMIVFGAACLFNHLLEKHLTHYWNEEKVVLVDAQLSEPYANYTQVLYMAEKDIEPGHEIFASYGRDSWFSERSIPFDPTIAADTAKLVYNVDTLKRIGHCLSDLYMDESAIPMAGKGVFSKKTYKKGEIVAISPVITIPRHIVKDQMPSCVLENYVIAENEGMLSDMVLLPLTLAGMFNHGGMDANVAMNWHSWSDESNLASTLALTPDELVDRPFAPLDLAYRATRDIAAGEELLLHYGADWEGAWVEHLRHLQSWVAKGVLSLHTKPQFRHTIAAPDGLFPAHWRTGCAGSTCIEHEKKVAEKRANLEKSQNEHIIMIQSASDFAHSHFASQPLVKSEL